MLYKRENFNRLERMTAEDLIREVELAKDNYDLVQAQFIQLEKDMKEECGLLQPNLDILLNSLNNIEGYIRRAENLMYAWDSQRKRKVSSPKEVLQEVCCTLTTTMKINKVKPRRLLAR